ncbi:MAG: helix-turn-helix domain-containing protein [Treponema sp.]|nr:helix-turn-helix domain-containing protein [Treponema sp.]
MKDNNYWTVLGWMRNKLKLSGYEVEVYAIIYGFSQDKDSQFKGSCQYLADAVGVSKRTIISILGKLVEKGYILKTKRGKFFDYQASSIHFPGGDKSEESSPSIGEKIAPVKKLHHKGEESSPVTGENISPHITIRDIPSHNKFSGSEEPLKKSLISKPKDNFELTMEQLKLYRSAKDCFEMSEKSKALMYQDKLSTAREMQHLKTLVIRCTNMAPGITADFMLNVLEHFKIMCNGKYRSKMVFTPQSLITPWIWALVINSLPENESPEVKEIIRGLFK